ncbi:uncharacterized protein HGUI_01296 [Hanseniaspora guilliermondii]|uniref:Structural maintenance of chromosomes protein 5 n=1 Tax=Hanseniaspora guilliermondii TaxID=56406 RepID=A0A1L0AYD4_9ASCO|nr:uncharacterized protein HGUI_01296 [Hanseniaspora guilliermondii]
MSQHGAMIKASKKRFEESFSASSKSYNETQFTSVKKKLKIKDYDLKKYTTGNIIQVDLFNFMVYTRGKFNFDSNLNMILGANGSGKSSVLCAINIVLCGALSNIGRASEMENFIKKDCDVGAITILLKSNYQTLQKNFKDYELQSMNITPQDETISITRKMFRYSENRSRKHEYLVNNAKISNDTIIKLIVDAFNIQLDNLTQFLSQERAREFAALNPNQLLATTLKSIDINLYNEWKNLGSLEKERDEIKRLLKQKQDDLNEAREMERMLLERVRNNEAYTNLEDNIALHKDLLVFYKFKDLKRGLQSAENEYLKAKELYEESNATLKKFANSDKVYKNISEKLKNEISHLKQNASKVCQTDNNIKVVQEHAQSAQRAIASLHQLSNAKKKLEVERSKYVAAFENAKSQYENFNISSEEEAKTWKQQRIDVNNEKREFQQNNDEVNASIKSLKRKVFTHTQSITKIQNELTGKDVLLRLNEDDRNRFRNALDAAKKNNISDKVYPPAVCVLNVIDDAYADLMNTIISKNTAIALTYTDESAVKAIGKYVTSNLGLNSFVLSNSPLSAPPLSTSELKNLGFDGYAADFLEGDENVRKMVIEKNKLHLTPVKMTELDQNMLEKIKNLTDNSGRLLFSQILAGNSSYRFIKSKYDGQVTVSTSSIVRGQYFRKNDNNNMPEEYKQRLSEKINSLHNEITQTENEIADKTKQYDKASIKIHDLRVKIDSLTENIRNYERQYKTYRGLRDQMNRYKKNIEDCDENIKRVSSKSSSSVKAKYLNNIVTCNVNQAVAMFKPISSSIRDGKDSYFNMMKKSLILQGVDNEELLTKNDLTGIENENEKLKNDYYNKKSYLESLQEEEDVTRLEKKIAQFSKTRITEIKQVARSIEGCNATKIIDIIKTMNSEIMGMDFDSSSVHQLEQKQQEIAEIVEVLPVMTEKYEKIDSDFVIRDTSLRSRLITSVDGISDKFEQLFKNVGCKGKVVLSQLDRPYKLWELEIQVAFRLDAPMQTLSGKTHSGGEQSVSTVTYLISLQRYSKAPFVVIDEINQGMDANNERKIHEILVRETCSPEANEGSQYILITPKLLTNLYYAHGMQCNIIFAGLGMPNIEKDPALLNLGSATLYDL